MTTDLDFPSVLPCFLREGYDIQHASPFVRSEMVTGRARQRRAYTSVPSEAQVSLLLTSVEAQVFESWFAYDAADGANWFNATIKTPVGLRPYVCRFVEMYKGPTLTGRELWRFTCRLEIYERPILSGGWAAYYPEAVLQQDIIDIALNQEWPAA